ncbi:ABC-2 type transporter-domain-containing protein [Scheffersomyces amazonensis]|uniref:ABC-2 type transporter-domain-containing protein n=1 Tax=Scheffersomyces amazonensis TaxID=1078765 RepID=UPI00315C77A9
MTSSNNLDLETAISSDDEHAINEFKGQDDSPTKNNSSDDGYDELGDDEGRRLKLVRSVTNNNETHFLERLESLSQQLSRHTTRDGEIRIDPENFDLYKILNTCMNIFEKEGIKLRKSGLSFEDLSMYGIDQSFDIASTITDLFTGPYHLAKKIISNKKTPTHKILHNINGLAKSGEMVLVLGRPGSGCSTLLKSLSGTDFDLYTGIEGDIRYDGIPQKEMMKSFKSDIIYNPELDVHFPHLTVEETLKFAIACKTPNVRIKGVSREQFINSLMEILATVFGLRHTYKTKVGNDFIRGVSGGERKRVSIAEALACRGSIYCWDNATRGLDASTALEYTRAIRTSTNLLNTTAFVTIYQAGENIYETFDKVTVLYSGHQIYYGPILEAKPYFEKMGFECLPRQSTAEFLTAVTDPNGRYPKKGWEHRVPKTAQEFEEYWLNSDEFKRLKQEISEYNKDIDADKTHELFYESLKQEKMKYTNSKSYYTINYYEQLKLTTTRAFQRIWNDKAYNGTLIFAGLAQGLIAGSLYYNTTPTVSGAFSRGGAVFFAVFTVSLMSLAEISAAFSSRPILMKQRNYSLYHPSAEALGNYFTSIPINFLVCVFFVIPLYFLTGLKSEAGAFFTALLFIYLSSMTMTALFQAVASLNKTVASANAFAGTLILAVLMYSSFTLQRPSMHDYFKWISYINPILYAFEAVISTEFHGRKMECDGNYLTPGGPGYDNLASGTQVCAFKGSVLGQTWVSGDEYLKVAFTYSFSHVWRNLGIIIAFLIFFVFVNALGSELVKPITGGGDRLLYIKGKVPQHLTGDIENNLGEGSQGEGKNNFVADEDLKAKDIFVWKDVKYVIPYDGKERTLLDTISGYTEAGTIVALMGESGAGKTTLLNTLAQRIDMGVVTGDMLVNGKPLDMSFSRRTGYVQQQDIHVSQTTVRESLQFAARLRRSTSVPDSEKLAYVEKIIKVLDMEEYADAVVGESGSGLNVEQRKKLSIGVELVAKPSLLMFLDEPTSGLDSQSAWSIVQLLRSLADAGQSIVCTIHQPSATLFEQFDRLLLLRKGGQTVYFGDIGTHSNTVLNYFERNGARKCEDGENPAEYILEAIGAGATASTSYNWFDIWNNSPEKIATDKRRDELIIESSQKSEGVDDGTEKSLISKYATPFHYQFYHVLKRTHIIFWRDPQYFAAKLALVTMCGLFIGFSFFGLKHSLTGAQNGMFVSFLAVVVSAPIINQVQEKAIKGRELFEGREKLSNTYTWSLMILTQIIMEIPYLIFGATIMFVSLYFPTQANTSGPHAGIFYLAQGVFLQFFVVSFGCLILYIAPDLETAAVIVSFLYTFIVAFSGVVQPVSLMPGFWTFMHKVSPYTYFIQNLVSAVLHGRKITCSQVELAFFNPPPNETCGEFMADFLNSRGGYLTNPSATSQCGYCQYTNADDYLLTIGAKYAYRWRNIGFFCVYFIFNVSFVLFLYYTFRYKKFSLKGLFGKK